MPYLPLYAHIWYEGPIVPEPSLSHYWGFRQAQCPVVAQTQGYHLVCIWGSLVKFQGDGVVVKFDVFSHCCAGAVCMQAMAHSVDNVPSQQGVKLVIVGLGLIC